MVLVRDTGLFFLIFLDDDSLPDDPGEVAEEKDHDNTDEDGGQVCLTISTFVGLHFS